MNYEAFPSNAEILRSGASPASQILVRGLDILEQVAGGEWALIAEPGWRVCRLHATKVEAAHELRAGPSAMLAPGPRAGMEVGSDTVTWDERERDRMEGPTR